MLDIVEMQIKRIKADSVVDLAYERIRTMVEDGELAPGARFGQGELADAFGISRTTVREALHRLAGELLVEFQTNRGFFVAAFRLDDVVRRLEVREGIRTRHRARSRPSGGRPLTTKRSWTSSMPRSWRDLAARHTT